MFGVPIADLSMTETIALIGELVTDGRSFDRTHQIATTNVDFLVNALEDPELLAILQAADVCLADGMPVVWGSSLLGMPITERVAGADLLPLLVEVSAITGWRIHVFGSSPSVGWSSGRAVRRAVSGRVGLPRPRPPHPRSHRRSTTPCSTPLPRWTPTSSASRSATRSRSGSSRRTAIGSVYR